MYHRWLGRLSNGASARRLLWVSPVLSMVLVASLLVMPASAAMRFQNRGLYMSNNEPGDRSNYTINWRYMSPQVVGSVDVLFCVDPIPYHACVTPPGLNASAATLVNQTGETGFTIQSRSVNHIVLTRLPSMIMAGVSSYTFNNIRNSTDESKSFSIRLRSHQSMNATGPQIDFGSVKGQVRRGIVLETQVPPMLIFCVAQQVDYNCTATNEIYYTDMGELSPRSTLKAQSQMAVGTNASGGFAITANGISMSAGTNVINGLTRPTESKQGINQFGINLVANTNPAVGGNPEGPWTNAIPAPDYSVANRYKYVPGDVVAYSPNVSLMKKFTVSYIVNSNENLRPGVYTTTITYIATGQF